MPDDIRRALFATYDSTKPFDQQNDFYLQAADDAAEAVA